MFGLPCWEPYTIPIPVGLLVKVVGVGGLSSYGGNLAIQSLLVAVMTYIITISIGKTFQRINDNAYKINGGQASGLWYRSHWYVCPTVRYVAVHFIST